MRIRILLLMSSWGLMTLSAFGLSKTIDVKTAGKLSELIKAGDAVTELSITGHINKADFAYIDTALVKVEKLDLVSVYWNATTGGKVGQSVVRNAVGHPLGAFYGYVSEGVDRDSRQRLHEQVGIESESCRRLQGQRHAENHRLAGVD